MREYLKAFDWAELYDIALEFGCDVMYDDDKDELIDSIIFMDVTIQDIEAYLDEEYIPY